jgi:SAM-dependent methyltransferase
VQVQFVEQDMREFVRPGAFGLAINLFTSLGYFDDRADDLKVLANVQRSLAPGGALVVEMAGKEQLARDFQPTLSTKYPDGSVLVQRHEVVEDWCRLPGAARPAQPGGFRERPTVRWPRRACLLQRCRAARRRRPEGGTRRRPLSAFLRRTSAPSTVPQLRPSAPGARVKAARRSRFPRRAPQPRARDAVGPHPFGERP